MSGLIRGYTRHLTPASPGAARTDPLDRDLVVEWRFAPDTGLFLPDFAGRGNRGAVSGATWIASQYGPALNFTGGDYVDIPDTPSFDFDGDDLFSVEVFIRPTGLANRHGIFSTRSANAAGSWQLEIGRMPVGGAPINAIAVTGPATWILVVDNVLTVNEWAHIVYLRWGTNAADQAVYVDGVVTAVHSSANYNIASNNDNKEIGRGTSGAQPLEADIALVRLYDRVLSAQEIGIRREICLKRANPMTHVWVVPWVGPIAPPAPAEAGFRHWLGTFLGSWRSAAWDLTDEQKTLGGEPVVTLAIGAHTLTAFVVGYRYEERESGGGLTIWLDNRDDEFDDLAVGYPGLVRGAAIDLRRGLPVLGVATVMKLPRTWIEGLRYVFVEGAALLRLDCIEWRDKAGHFRYDTRQAWSATEVATIAGSILGQVGLSLAAGTFSFTTSFAVSVRRDAEGALMDVMERVDEVLYAGEDGEILHKVLDPSEGAGYAYDWGQGGEPPCNHPLLRGSGATGAITEIAEASPRYNTVSVIGGPDGEFSGSANDAAEVALVGTRRRTLTDDALGSDAQCAERARAELRRWQAGSTSGLIVARPDFTLRLYDVVNVAAPPWGGPALTGRVMGYVEEYGRGRGIWEQRISIGGGETRGIGSGDLIDGVIIGKHVDAQPVAAGSYKIREGDSSEILLAITAEEDAGTGTTSTLEIRGKDGTSPEGYAELVAITTDGAVHSGVASVTFSLDTETGVVELGGGIRVRLGEIYLEMTEQSGADPAAPGANRCRLFLRDNGGKTELCARFPTGAIQQVAIEP